jgi:hypothetical protein
VAELNTIDTLTHQRRERWPAEALATIHEVTIVALRMIPLGQYPKGDNREFGYQVAQTALSMASVVVPGAG